MENKLTHDIIIGSGLASGFINLMKLEGWLPVKEYFTMINSGIELDWVMVLTMENDGFIAIPSIAEYCIPHPDSGQKPGWYDSGKRRLDDWTNVIMFKPVEAKNTANRIRDELLDEHEEKENIKNVPDFEDAFTETLIKLCKGNSEHYIKKLIK